MSAHIRLTRTGKAKRPYYRVVVVDSRDKRDGAYIDLLGYYQPLEGDGKVQIDLQKYEDWKSKGVQVSGVVSNLVKKIRKAQA